MIGFLGWLLVKIEATHWLHVHVIVLGILWFLLALGTVHFFAPVFEKVYWPRIKQSQPYSYSLRHRLFGVSSDTLRDRYGRRKWAKIEELANSTLLAKANQEARRQVTSLDRHYSDVYVEDFHKRFKQRHVNPDWQTGGVKSPGQESWESRQDKNTLAFLDSCGKVRAANQELREFFAEQSIRDRHR